MNDDRIVELARNYLKGDTLFLSDNDFITSCSMVYDIEPDVIRSHLWLAEQLEQEADEKEMVNE